MFTTPTHRRRHASARRTFFACLLAAFFAFNQLAFVPPPAASAQRKTVPALTPKTREKLTKRTASQISVTTLGSALTESFNSLSNTGTANTWTDNSTIAGWYAQWGTDATNPTTYRASTGSENNGALYSYGPASNTDRALGSVGSGTTTTVYWAVQFTNNTGSTITSLDISYVGEQWRQGGCTGAGCAPAAQTVDFEYQVAAAGTITDANNPTTGWTAHDPLDFTSPNPGSTATASALDGNNATNRTALSSTITVSIPNGQEFWLRWVDINHANNDHGLAIDELSVTPQGAGGPGLPTLSINDVSQNEGNAGTTAFNFTVSLTAAAAADVTFDVCTEDGTAQDASNPGEDDDYSVLCVANQSITAGQTSTQITVNVNGDTDTEPNENFFVNISNVSANATAGDTEGEGTIVNDDFSVVPIHDIQGNGDASPYDGQTLSTTGIVTLLRTGSNGGSGTASGFFLQTPDADADPNTSEGILVFTNSVPTVAVGDEVVVTGTVDEFFNMTEITSVTNVTVIDTGNTLPTAVTLDSTILDPTAQPTQPQLEKYEGMRMTAASLTSVAPNDNFFDVYTVLSSVARPVREPGIPASDPVPPDPTSGVPDCCIAIWDENPERLLLDTNARAGAPNVPYTSLVTFTSVSGPLDFSFGAYRLIPDAAPTATANISATPLPEPGPNEFMVAGINIENFNNNATQRQKAALGIRDVMRLPAIIGTIEIFDLADLQALAAELNTIEAGVNYEARLEESDGGAGGDNDQDVGFLVDTNRVSIQSTTREREEETFVDPVGGDTETLHDRPPFVLRATVDPTGANPLPVIVVVNHLRSFIDIELVAGEGIRVREKRKKQAESLADLLNDLQTENPGVPLISIGDYNAFQFSSGYDDSISVIKGSPTADDQIVVDQSPDLVDPNLTNIIEEVPAAERYSFIFEGTPQALDHILVNQAALDRKTRVEIAHMNADFPENPASAYASNAAIPERHSDHDPAVAYFFLGEPQPTGTLIISEFRFRGPGVDLGGGDVLTTGGPDRRSKAKAMAELTPDANDEFIEFYNNTNDDIVVATTDGSAGWSLVASDGAVRFTIPVGTIIPARTYYLATNTLGYSLATYGEEPGFPGAGGDIAYTSDIPDGGGVALFRTANPANFSESERLDAAGYSTAPALYREGAGLNPNWGHPAGGGGTTQSVEHSQVRTMDRRTTGRPKDTGDNLADFVLVIPDPSVDDAPMAVLGAPGPQDSNSPVERNGEFPISLIDPTKTTAQSPNRVRVLADQDPRGMFGTMAIRKTFTNNTTENIRRLRFRIVEFSTYPGQHPSHAELLAINSTLCDESVEITGGTTVEVDGTEVEQPPVQPNGGGLNSSLDIPCGDINTDVALEPGQSFSVEFLFAVNRQGAFRFFINVEALPEDAGGVPPSSSGRPQGQPRDRTEGPKRFIRPPSRKTRN